jgi:serine/threonine protein kinase
MYFGSCKDILESINSFYANNQDEMQNEAAMSQSENIIDRADEQKRLCFNEHSLQPITKAILSALEYLHSKHIIHRCICPENIYISQTGHIYLAGLNYSTSMIEQGTLCKKMFDYPPNLGDYVNYFSPEMLQQVNNKFKFLSNTNNFFQKNIFQELEGIQSKVRYLQLRSDIMRTRQRNQPFYWTRKNSGKLSFKIYDNPTLSNFFFIKKDALRKACRF